MKYVKMNVTLSGGVNGCRIGIWLDQVLKNELGKVIEWNKADKEDYLSAMKITPTQANY